MSSALIGYTGFVGGNLISQTRFDDLYNSSNIENIQGKYYGLIVVAGAPAVKWKANKEPQQDLENLSRLMGCLDKAAAGFVILISTVDVYPTAVEIDEDAAALVDQMGEHAKTSRWRAMHAPHEGDREGLPRGVGELARREQVADELELGSGGRSSKRRLVPDHEVGFPLAHVLGQRLALCRCELRIHRIADARAG